MLNIHFGEMDNMFYGPSWFKANYDPEWLADPLVEKMLNDVDKSSYKGGNLIDSEVLGPISPGELSGGVQTLISIYENPDLVFNATSCGENCAKWLLEIGRQKDVTVVLEYFMNFRNMGPYRIHILNTGVTVDNDRDYTYAALDLLNAEESDER